VNLVSLDELLHDIAATTSVDSGMSAKDIIPLIDLTRLDTQATSQEIKTLALKAEENHVAAICVLPEHLAYVPSDLHIKRATVINFPTGNQPQQQVLKSLEQTISSQQVDEIDYVFSYQAYLAGEKDKALDNYREVYERCKQHKLSVKVILETGALPSHDVIYEVSKAIISVGCDFLKTSTGKIAQGATLPAAFAILSAIVDSNSLCGIKISGGVKTEGQALSFMQLAVRMLKKKVDNTWFRLGASSLLDDLLKMHKETQHA
jgi:deoxyribose-phosphate aldolase